MKKKEKLIPPYVWGAVVLIIVLFGITMIQNGWLKSKRESAPLSGGGTFSFEKENIAGAASLADMDVSLRPLTEEETTSVFGDLGFTGNALFSGTITAETEKAKFLGFQGNVGNVELVISTTDSNLRDTVIIGTEQENNINGTSVLAGYFVTDKNSRGEQNAIFYSTFTLGEADVYVENAGPLENKESVKRELVDVIQKMVEKGKLDFQIR